MSDDKNQQNSGISENAPETDLILMPDLLPDMSPDNSIPLIDMLTSPGERKYFEKEGDNWALVHERSFLGNERASITNVGNAGKYPTISLSGESFKTSVNLEYANRDLKLAFEGLAFIGAAASMTKVGAVVGVPLAAISTAGVFATGLIDREISGKNIHWEYETNLPEVLLDFSQNALEQLDNVLDPVEDLVQEVRDIVNTVDDVIDFVKDLFDGNGSLDPAYERLCSLVE